MVLYLKQITREKDMFLKKNKFFLLIFFFIFIFNTSVLSNEKKIEIIKNYLSELKFFSASFIQNDGLQISEGKIFIGDKRVRVEYKEPSKILIILGENNGMYYNYELEEDEFFDPKDTPAWFFYDTFNNLNFFNGSEIKIENNNIIAKKEGLNKIGEFKIEVFFEDNPLLIRRIILEIDDEFMSLSFFNHKYNEEFDTKFFKLINPSFFN